MNFNKGIFIVLGSLALISAFFVGSYLTRQNQYQQMLTEIEQKNHDGFTITETDNKVVVSDIEKLNATYEDAMEKSGLLALEKDKIRLMVGKEEKAFEEALELVRPGIKIVEQIEVPIGNQNTEKSSNNEKSITPTNPSKQDNTTPKTNEVESSGKDFNNSGIRTTEQKQADEDAFNDWSGGHVGGPGRDTSYDPDF